MAFSRREVRRNGMDRGACNAVARERNQVPCCCVSFHLASQSCPALQLHLTSQSCRALQLMPSPPAIRTHNQIPTPLAGRGSPLDSFRGKVSQMTVVRNALRADTPTHLETTCGDGRWIHWDPTTRVHTACAQASGNGFAAACAQPSGSRSLKSAARGRAAEKVRMHLT